MMFLALHCACISACRHVCAAARTAIVSAVGAVLMLSLTACSDVADSAGVVPASHPTGQAVSSSTTPPPIPSMSMNASSTYDRIQAAADRGQISRKDAVVLSARLM